MRSVLYVTEPGMLVHLTGERVIVRRGKERVCEARLEEIERIVLCSGAAGLTTQAATALMEAGIEVSLGLVVGEVSGVYVAGAIAGSGGADGAVSGVCGRGAAAGTGAGDCGAEDSERGDAAESVRAQSCGV